MKSFPSQMMSWFASFFFDVWAERLHEHHRHSHSFLSFLCVVLLLCLYIVLVTPLQSRSVTHRSFFVSLCVVSCRSGRRACRPVTLTGEPPANHQPRSVSATATRCSNTRHTLCKRAHTHTRRHHCDRPTRPRTDSTQNNERNSKFFFVVCFVGSFFTREASKRSLLLLLFPCAPTFRRSRWAAVRRRSGRICRWTTSTTTKR